MESHEGGTACGNTRDCIEHIDDISLCCLWEILKVSLKSAVKAGLLQSLDKTR